MEWKMENGKWKKKIMVKKVATTSLPVDRLTATDCNAAARANTIHFLPERLHQAGEELGQSYLG